MEIIMYRNLICSSFMAYHRFSTNSNTTGATRGASTTYPSRAHGFTPVWFALFDLWFYAWYFVHHCVSFYPFSFGHCVVWFLIPLSVSSNFIF